MLLRQQNIRQKFCKRIASWIRCLNSFILIICKQESCLNRCHCAWTSLHVPACVQHKNCHVFLGLSSWNYSHADAPLMNIVNCSQQRSSWISPIIPRCVLHEHCLRMSPAWISSTVCKSWASGILSGPAPCTLHPAPRMRPASITVPDASASCILHISVPGCISVLYPASIVSSLDGCILHWRCCPWLELPWFIVLHVEVIY